MGGATGGLDGAADGLVGREVERARLAALVNAAMAGRAGAMLVSGEAGIGKTSLVRAVCEEHPVGVLWASCPPLSSLASPFLPLRSALRTWSGRAAGGGAASLLGLGEGAAVGDVAMDLDAWLDRATAERPVVLVVDDLQWADHSTWDVLKYLLAGLAGSGERRLAVLMTLRTGEAADTDSLRTWLADVRRLPGVGEMPLGRLDRLGTRDQVAGLLGDQPFESLVDEVHARTGGNPYLTTLLVRGLSGGARALPAGLPAELGDAVARLWRGLSTPARWLTQLLAVGGRPQPAGRTAEVVAAAGLEVDVVALQREAVDAGVLVLDDQERYWFGHPLVAEALSAAMLPEERQSAHAAYVAVLGPRAGSGDGGDADQLVELADHCLGAGDLEQAYAWALQAATATERVGGATETIRLLRRASALASSVDDTEAPGGLLDRVRMAAERAGDWEEELKAVDDLLAVVDSAAEPGRAARLFVRRMQLRHVTGRRLHGLADAREAVRISSAAPASAEHALALSALALAELWHGVSSGPATARSAVQRARARDDPEALAFALVVGLMASLQTGRNEVAGSGTLEAAGAEAQEAAVRSGSWLTFVTVVMWMGNSMDSALSPAVVAQTARGREYLAAQRAPHCYTAWLAATEALGLLHLGRWRECLDRLRLALGSSPGPMGDTNARLVAAELACRQGRRHEAEGHLARAEELFAPLSDYRALPADAVRATLAVAAGDADRALAVVPDPDALEAPTHLVERIVPLAAQALVDEAEAARSRNEDPAPALARLRDLRARHPHVPVDVGPGDHYRKVVRAMQAWYDAELVRAHRGGDAAASWAEAADACQDALLPWDEAYTRWRAAEALLADRTSRTEGAEALRRAHRLAEDLQALPLLREVERLATAARVGWSAPEPVVEAPPTPGLPGLTNREREVLAHVIAGRTYAEIARELVISEKTVSVHVSNLLRKTGTTNRLELARLAGRTVPPG